MAKIDREKLNRVVSALGYEGVLLADGFDDALIGIGTRFNAPVAIYNYDACLVSVEAERRMACDEKTHDDCAHWIEAQEHMTSNVTGAYVGDSTPIYVRFTPDVIDELAGEL